MLDGDELAGPDQAAGDESGAVDVRAGVARAGVGDDPGCAAALEGIGGGLQDAALGGDHAEDEAGPAGPADQFVRLRAVPRLL